MKYSELKPGQSFMYKGRGPYYKLSPNSVLDVVCARIDAASKFIYHTGAPNYFLAMMFEDNEVEPLET